MRSARSSTSGGSSLLMCKVLNRPLRLQRAADLLKASLVSALSDDLAIESWIQAKYRGDAAATNAALQRNERLSQQASIAKAQFLKVYNAVRHRLLGLAALDVAY